MYSTQVDAGYFGGLANLEGTLSVVRFLVQNRLQLMLVHNQENLGMQGIFVTAESTTQFVRTSARHKVALEWFT